MEDPRLTTIDPSLDGAQKKATQRITHSFDAQAFLDSTDSVKKIVDFRRGEIIYSQGDACHQIMYLQQGGVKLSVLSKMGKEAVVAMLMPGDFFGEGCLAGHTVRTATATAVTASRILMLEKDKMFRLLHKQHGMSDRFIAHMLSRNSRIEEDLIDQLFNSCEKRLARTLLLLARYGGTDSPQKTPLAKISQETLAQMIGTTRSRVNFFMNKFKKAGYISTTGGLKVNSSLISVVLHD
jgi:CRP/FNR family transcriptional regulator, cyclic AMP receptor protein